jgi:hypothetical protein
LRIFYRIRSTILGSKKTNGILIFVRKRAPMRESIDPVRDYKRPVPVVSGARQQSA